MNDFIRHKPIFYNPLWASLNIQRAALQISQKSKVSLAATARGITAGPASHTPTLPHLTLSFIHVFAHRCE